MKENRNKVIIKVSAIGVMVNVSLSALKLAIGLMTNSIAITMDAVNNVADVASSVITIVGTKLANKEPDQKHPFGYGRLEYFSALIISMIVLYAGFTSLGGSVKSIFHPEMPTYTWRSLSIIAIGIVVKVILGKYFVQVGKQVDSGSLIGAGEESIWDAVISFATLVAAGIYMLTTCSLEAYLAAVISVIIVKSGVKMLRETISRLLGERVDAALAKEIGATIRGFSAVNGVYDLILNDYGPDAYQGSVHVEVPDTCTAMELDDLTRSIMHEVFRKHHVLLTAIGVYSTNTKDEQAIKMREQISKIALADQNITQIHGFYLDVQKKVMRFDLVVSFGTKERKSVYQAVVDRIQAQYPDYLLNVAMDTDFTTS